ncbi:hypothetical protein [Neorhodopirellula pilleata]|uniref:hypothetical protein n=1 Tax=Neorhodopirellula pilleata TaxID=2714738 RepID=UPI0011B45E14|nr:hypothetical protein [Neorhodopirellula pilleata]
MTVWTSRIALIAYVLGGWLLPALHHHDHADSGSDRHGIACHPSQTAGGEVVAATDCGCSHEHQPVDESPKTTAAEHDLVNGHSHSDCVGLCSLCVATTLLATSYLPDAMRVGLVCDRSLSPCRNQAWPWQPLPGGISSRGPPATV